eukprot:gene20375-16787_t
MLLCFSAAAFLAAAAAAIETEYTVDEGLRDVEFLGYGAAAEKLSVSCVAKGHGFWG